MLHLLSLATLEDLANFRQDVQKHSEIFLQHCERCINIVDKETENCKNGVETVDAMASQLNILNVRLQVSRTERADLFVDVFFSFYLENVLLLGMSDLGKKYCNLKSSSRQQKPKIH